MSQDVKVTPVHRNLVALGIVERVGSVFSLLGCIFILTTFCFSKSFHKPINRLVFYASLGNGIVNIATLMATSYVGTPDSLGCQVQAFLIQMFMPADALWTLAMAINVYLTFYRHYDAADLRRMEVMYMICCYGIPFVPAIIYIFVKDSDGNRAYGNAALWCWVSKEWGIWRILTFYGPVWLVIFTTLSIYIRTGGDIYRNRKQLRYVSRSDIETITSTSTWLKTTEIHVTSEAASKSPEPGLHGRIEPKGCPGTSSSHKTAYSVSISANPDSRDSREDTILSVPNQLPEDPSNTKLAPALANVARPSMSQAEWSYAKCSMLFFTAMLVTWIPSSANRVYSVVHNNHSSVVLEFMSAVVLPLQGFWNASIYILTSWKACKMVFEDVRHFRRFRAAEPVCLEPADHFRTARRGYGARGDQRSESKTQLASSVVESVAGSSSVGRSAA
ncbi:hypothetical protein AK830_g11349 [Neonectria ditissima]|uniref:G-protein coupled receptors family 2 profile 2 domain-containing protein n=1 Tax=Neonectria ditissima TaxID=78410 RepID=A0A0P7B8A6_9HYPO|nr:hypothetical protein AK830_g11349 [Neonectria ditissima]